MVLLPLNPEEALFLATQLERHLQTVENELVHTDVRAMQHELSNDLQRLREIRSRVESALSRAREEERVSVPLAP